MYLCSASESLYIRKRGKVFFFYINEAQFNKKVNHQSLSIFSVDEMEITAVQHRQSIVVSEGQRRSGVSNIGRKRNAYHCYHVCECQWIIHTLSIINGVLEKKHEGGAYGWSNGGLDFGVTS